MTDYILISGSSSTGILYLYYEFYRTSLKANISTKDADISSLQNINSVGKALSCHGYKMLNSWIQNLFKSSSFYRCLVSVDAHM